MTIKLVVSAVDTSSRGVGSALYTYSKTPDMQLCLLRARHRDGTDEWYGDGHGRCMYDDDDGVEFWAPSLAGALTYLRTTVSVARLYGVTSMTGEQGMESEKVRDLLRVFAPDTLDIRAYPTAQAVVEANDHVRYVTRKLSELLGALEDGGFIELLENAG